MASLALGLVAMSGLAGCADSKKMWRESEIEAIASDAASDAAGDVAGNYGVEGFEQRITTLEQEKSNLELEVASLRSDIELMRSDLRSLESQYGTHTHY